MRGVWHLHWRWRLHRRWHSHLHRLRHCTGLSNVLLNHLIIQEHHFFRSQALTSDISFLFKWIYFFVLLRNKSHYSASTPSLALVSWCLLVNFLFFFLQLFLLLLSSRLLYLESIFDIRFSIFSQLFEFGENLVNSWLVREF